jgi:signal transduction histidine kinase
MTEATLAFARDDAATEKSRTVDLAALIDSLCEDLVDAGTEVIFDDADRTPYSCRPEGLRRAIRNLVENAVRYGCRARISLEHCGSEFRVVICDDGAGSLCRNAARVPAARRRKILAAA